MHQAWGGYRGRLGRSGGSGQAQSSCTGEIAERWEEETRGPYYHSIQETKAYTLKRKTLPTTPPTRHPYRPGLLPTFQSNPPPTTTPFTHPRFPPSENNHSPLSNTLPATRAPCPVPDPPRPLHNVRRPFPPPAFLTPRCRQRSPE